MRCVAIDLGAESCRVSLADTRDARTTLQVVHRFANQPVERGGALVWDLAGIVAGVETGLRMCAERAAGPIDSIGVDGWAVDYVRLGADGRPLADPYCYRDARTATAMAEVWQRIPPERLYAITGIQFLRFNTLYQLYADTMAGLPEAERWLNLPEYLLYHLGAAPIAEYTNATHTQLIDARTRQWSDEIFQAAGLKRSAAPPIVPPGSVVGVLRGPLVRLGAFRQAQLIAPACHDTASAVAGIAGVGDRSLFISSGTWSLVGCVLEAACISEAARRESFSNEGHVGGSVRFLKNVNGMWLIEECLREWRQLGLDWTVAALASACAERAPAAVALPEFLVDDPDLLLPGHMPQRIAALLARAGAQAPPQLTAREPAFDAAVHWAALIFVNLARRYRDVIHRLTRLTGRQFTEIWVVGGGSRNSYLNALIGQMTGLLVRRGPVESSTVGNAAIQFASLERKARGDSRPLDRAAVAERVTTFDIETS